MFGWKITVEMVYIQREKQVELSYLWSRFEQTRSNLQIIPISHFQAEFELNSCLYPSNKAAENSTSGSKGSETGMYGLYPGAVIYQLCYLSQVTVTSLSP